jgi:putative exporter of polyketide antibiotics
MSTHQQNVVALGKNLVDELIQLVRLEIDLAKQEIREMVMTDIKAVVFFIVAGVILLVAVIFGLIALTFLLGYLIPSLGTGWWVFIFFVLFVVTSVVLMLLGKSRLRIGPPEHTIATLREDVEWAKLQIKRVEK